MNPFQILREARRRLAVQRALGRGKRIGGLGLLGPGHDALLMKTPASLQAVDPVDRLLRYVNAEAEFPLHAAGGRQHRRRSIGTMINDAWQARLYPNFARWNRRADAEGLRR